MRKFIQLLTALIALTAHWCIAQTPDAALSNLSQEMRDWVNRSCPSSLGPSLWSSCVVREASAASQGKPNLGHFQPDIRTWITSSCPDSLGPSLTINCLIRESTAVSNASLDISSLNEKQRQWLLSVCSPSLGPSLFISCAQRESAALHGIQSIPQKSASVPPQQPRTMNRGGKYNSYEIEVAHNDELFIINGEKFEAQTYCLGWENGDEVIFIDGSPNGVCVSATLLNLRMQEKCDVWCE
ncbi:hypothetical protein [Aeromonas veronii]|uniref:hypothetical protein n=1 Tax=Aeromonas veronii TaxID=654 RepID=UPI0039F737DB